MTFGCCPPNYSIASWDSSPLLTHLLDEFSVSPKSTGFDSHECCGLVLGEITPIFHLSYLSEAATESPPIHQVLCHLQLLCHAALFLSLHGFPKLFLYFSLG